MRMYRHTQYAQVTSHKRLTSNSLFIQVILLMLMWFWPTTDFLPCSLQPDTTDNTTINWIAAAKKDKLPNVSDYGWDNGWNQQNYEIGHCIHNQLSFFDGIFVRLCGEQVIINTLAWHLLNFFSALTALRALWIQGLFGFTRDDADPGTYQPSSERSSKWRTTLQPFRDGFGLDPFTYFIALLQIIGVFCYLMFLAKWSAVRCQESPSMMAGGDFSCDHYCTDHDKMTFKGNAETINIWHWNIGSRIWDETSVVFSMLAMFCRVCRDFAVSKGLWQQRWSIFTPFMLLMLHSLVTQNSVVIIPGVFVFVTATFFSARIGKI